MRIFTTVLASVGLLTAIPTSAQEPTHAFMIASDAVRISS